MRLLPMLLSLVYPACGDEGAAGLKVYRMLGESIQTSVSGLPALPSNLAVPSRRSHASRGRIG